jgi:hypothetical protein
VLCLLLAEICSREQNVELVLVVRPTEKAEDHFERVGCLKQYGNHTPVLPTPSKVNSLREMFSGLEKKSFMLV